MIIAVSDCICDQLSNPDLAHDPGCPQHMVEIDVELIPKAGP